MRVLVLIALIGAQLAAAEPSIEWVGERRAHLTGLVYWEQFPERTIRVHVPPGYAEGDERYRVLYCFDDGPLSDLDKDPERQGNTLDVQHDALLADGLIHPTIFVAIPSLGHGRNGPGDRGFELNPHSHLQPRDGGEIGPEIMQRWIAEVLKPAIDGAFRTLPEREHTGVHGFSYGGLAAAWLSRHHSQMYGFAGMMSPSFFGEHWRDFYAEETPLAGTRLWFQAGLLEGREKLINLRRAVRSLVGHGWAPEREVALFYDHDHGHNYYPAPVRHMLRFLLGREAPADPELHCVTFATGATGATGASRAAERCAPSAEGEFASLLPELRFADGYVSHPVHGEWTIADSRIASFDGDPFLPELHAAGSTTARIDVTLDDEALTAAIPIESRPLGEVAEFLSVPAVATAPTIDGQLDEWAQATFFPGTEDGVALSARRHGDGLVVAVRVRDEALIDGRHDRDAVTLILHPEAWRAAAIARSPKAGERLTASPVGDVPIRWRDFAKRGGQVACAATEDGYAAEFLIPAALLPGGSDWSAVRINAVVADVDQVDAHDSTRWWRPAWPSADNRVGSGILRREDVASEH